MVLIGLKNTGLKMAIRRVINKVKLVVLRLLVKCRLGFLGGVLLVLFQEIYHSLFEKVIN